MTTAPVTGAADAHGGASRTEETVPLGRSGAVGLAPDLTERTCDASTAPPGPIACTSGEAAAGVLLRGR